MAICHACVFLPRQCDSVTGNLDNHLVCIDAMPARRIGGAEKQYRSENILREINKAYVGFQQDALMAGKFTRKGGCIVDYMGYVVFCG